MSEISKWDWVPGPPQPPFKREIVTNTQAQIYAPKETAYDRKLRMLRQLSQTCAACTMCELGAKDAVRGTTIRDPHVLSNMNPKRFMVVGQNPGWTELEKCEPFVGAAGKNFDEELAKNGLSRQDFYICNTVRCFTQGNEKPTEHHIETCKPFLSMEISLIKPLLIVALGAVAFERLCPGVKFSDSLKKIVKNAAGQPVFAVYHPSPMNVNDPERRAAFNEQMAVLCGVVGKLKEKYKLE